MREYAPAVISCRAARGVSYERGGIMPNKKAMEWAVAIQVLGWLCFVSFPRFFGWPLGLIIGLIIGIGLIIYGGRKYRKAKKE